MAKTTSEALEALDLEDWRAHINQKLDQYLPGPADVPQALAEAMRYSVMAGGKRLRALVLVAAHRACGGVMDEDLWRTAAAIEYLHTFSLIHDDLPCMDDDDLRRGIPTCHKKFGEGIAVLAGDALAVLAFELLGRTGQVELVVELARAIGAQGMIGGQVDDLAAEGTHPELAAVQSIHARKTAALFQASAVAGGLLARGGDEALQALATYGRELGLAFQIKDDLLDCEGETRVMGKSAGADERRHKATYPRASSVERARDDAQRAAERARAALDSFTQRGGLESLIAMAVEREA